MIAHGPTGAPETQAVPVTSIRSPEAGPFGANLPTDLRRTLDAMTREPAAARPRYSVRVAHSWAAARADYEAAFGRSTATTFQDPRLVGAWYGAMAERADAEPVIVAVDDAASGQPALRLPLMRRRAGLVRTIAFADDHLVDYNAPVLGPAAPSDAAGARALWQTLRQGLPAADLLALRKMPPRIGERPNPFALLPALDCALNGNVVRMDDDLGAYFGNTLSQNVRSRLKRTWSAFTRLPGARFEVAAGQAERRRILDTLDRQQPLRMQHVGKRYGLAAPAATSFYRRLVDDDPAGEFAMLFALVADGQVGAAVCGLRSADGFTITRVSYDMDPAWSKLSPGPLLMSQIMKHLHADGVRVFDFSLGNYEYKRRFKVTRTPLVDLVRPLSPLGLCGAAAARGRVWLRRHPAIEDRLRAMLGRNPREGSPR